MALPKYLQDDTAPVDAPSYLQEPSPASSVPGYLQPPPPPPTPEPTPAPEPETPGVTDYLSVGLRGLTKVPGAVAASVVSAVQGQEGVEAPGQGDIFEERIVRPVAKGLRAFERETAEKFPESTAIQTLSRLPAGLGFSIPSAATGITAGLLTSPTEAVPGGQALPFVAGGAAAGATAYRTSSSEIMRSYIDVLDEEKRAASGVGLTNAEAEAAKADFSAKATEVGLWEALPEAIGGAVAGRLIFSPLKKMVGERIATSMAGRIGGVFGEELLTESVTQIGQSQALAGTKLAGEGEPLEFTPSGALKALKEVAPDTLLLTAVMGGGMSAGQGIYRRRQEQKLATQLGINRDELVSRVGDLLEAKQVNPELDISSPAAMDFLAGSVVVEEGEFAQPTDVAEEAIPAPKKEPVKLFTRLADTADTINYRIRGEDFSYKPPEGMTVQDVNTALEGKSDAAAVQWLKNNAEVVPRPAEVRDDTIQQVGDQIAEQERIVEPAARAERAVEGVEQPEGRTALREFRQPVSPAAVEQRVADVPAAEVVAPVQAEAVPRGAEEVTPQTIADAMGDPEIGRTAQTVEQAVNHFVGAHFDRAALLRKNVDALAGIPSKIKVRMDVFREENPEATPEEIQAREAELTSTLQQRRIDFQKQVVVEENIATKAQDTLARLNNPKVNELLREHMRKAAVDTAAVPATPPTGTADEAKPKLTPIAKYPPTELEVKRQAKELVEVKTKAEGLERLQELFGATYDELEARDEANPQRGTDIQLDIADDYMADIETAINSRDVKEAEALISQAYAAGLRDPLQEGARGLRAVEPRAAVGDVQPGAEVQSPIVPEGATLTEGVQEIAAEVDETLRFDGESEGTYYFTPSTGVSAGQTFTVTSPTKENIKAALATSRQTFTEERLEAEEKAETEAGEEAAAQEEFRTEEPRAIFAAADKKLKAGQTRMEQLLAAARKPKSALHRFAIQHAPKWLAFTPLSHLAQTYGKEIRQIQDIDRHSNQMDATRIQITDDFFAVYQAAERAASKGTGVDAFNRALLVGTFNQMTPWAGLEEQGWLGDTGTLEQRLKDAQTSWVAAGMQKTTNKSFVEAYNEASADFNKLDAESQKHFKKVVGFLADIRKRERNNLLATIEQVSEEGTVLRDSLMKRFEESFDGLRGIYAPLTRYGNYTLKYTEVDGREASESFETISDRDTFKESALKKGVDPNTMVESVQAEVPEGAAVIPQEFISQVGVALEQQYLQDMGTEDAESVEAAKQYAADTIAVMNQTLIRWLPDTAALKSSIHRKNIVGANPDMLRGALSYVQRHAGSIARSEVGKKIDADLQSFAEDNAALAKEGGVNLDMRMHLLNALRKWHMATKTDRMGPIATIAGRVSTAYFMTSPSTFLVQLSQLPMLTLPNLAAKYGSILGANKALSKGLQQAFSPKYNKDAMYGDEGVNRVYEAIHRRVGEKDRTPGRMIGEDWYTPAAKEAMIKKLSPYQKQLLALREALAMNLLDISAVHEANDIAQGNATTLIGKTFQLAMLPMQHGELGSRKAATLAAFDLASKKGKTFFDSMEDIKEVVDETLFSYAKNDKGWAMQKSVMRVPFTFQTYRIKVALRMALLFRDSIKGESAEVRSAARKEFTGIMGMSAMLAGAKGVVIAPAIFAILDMVLGDEDEPYDSELEFTNYLNTSLGETAGDVAAHGLPTLFGMNISRRIGLGDTFGMQSEAPIGMHGANLAAWWAGNLIGPMFSVGQGIFRGYDEIVNKGNYAKGLEVASPKPIKDGFKAYRVATEGLKTSQGKRLLPDDTIGADEVAMIALGFNADEVAKAYGAERSLRKISAQISSHKGRLIRDAARVLAESDDPEKVLRDIRAFNKKMPQFAITGGDIRPAVRKILKGELGVTGRRERLVAAKYDVPAYMR